MKQFLTRISEDYIELITNSSAKEHIILQTFPKVKGVPLYFFNQKPFFIDRYKVAQKKKGRRRYTKRLTVIVSED